MPELPEVETTVKDLRKAIIGQKIKNVWTDFPKNIKIPEKIKDFKKTIREKKIENIGRKGKNILIFLSGNFVLLIHLKMTGHLLIGNWNKKNNKWESIKKCFLSDSVNSFIHLIFWLDSGKMLALSDLRKFAKILLLEKEKLFNLEDLKKIGPDPEDKNFSFEILKKVLLNKKGKIKQVLMDQSVIAGIGNIYSDEILWDAKIHPLSQIKDLKDKDFKNIYKAMKKILKKAIKLRGDSMSDYRLLNGKKGGYQNVQKVYRQEGKQCQRKDKGVIKRIKIGGRSAHFCPICQKL